MINFLITISLISLAAICNVLMDKWMIKYMLLNDVQKIKPSNNWWSFNPSAKWLDGKYGTERAYNILLLKLGIKTTLFADNCNDAWHFFKSIMIVLLCIAIAVYVSYNQLFIYKLFEILVLGTVWNITFNITYNKIKI